METPLWSPGRSVTAAQRRFKQGHTRSGSYTHSQIPKSRPSGLPLAGMQEPLLQRHNLQTCCRCPVCSRRVLPRLPSQYEITLILIAFPHGETLSESAIWMLFPTRPSVFLSALQLKATGSICRPKSGDCDLEEYCTGFSASCPTDAFTLNGLDCNRGTGYCYNGQCPSHQQHCRRLWGPGKTSALEGL